jgi:hypothetical protein
LKDVKEKFAEIERRVKLLAVENRTFRDRVNELERELDKARREAQNAGHFQDKQLHLREKIERVLQSLESLEVKE